VAKRVSKPTGVVKPKEPDEETVEAEEEDKPLVEGGPGGGEPQLQRVKIGSREFDLTPEVAEAIAAREQEFVKQAGQVTDAIKSLREAGRQPARAQQTSQVVSPDDIFSGLDLDTDLYSDPKKVLGQFADRLSQRITTQLTGAYQARETEKTFWDTFYKENSDLVGDEMIVNAVLSANYNTLKDVKAGEAKNQLAELVRAETIRISKKIKPVESREVGIEGSSIKTSTPQKKEARQVDSGNTRSIIQVLAERKRRRNAASGGNAA